MKGKESESSIKTKRLEEIIRGECAFRIHRKIGIYTGTKQLKKHKVTQGRRSRNRMQIITKKNVSVKGVSGRQSDFVIQI